MASSKRRTVGTLSVVPPEVIAFIRKNIKELELLPCDLGMQTADGRYDNLSAANRRAMSATDRQRAWASALLHHRFCEMRDLNGVIVETIQ